MGFIGFLVSCLLFVAVANVRHTAGAENAAEGQFKYQVSLIRAADPICGGVIIGGQYVLTAAHCVLKENGQFNHLIIKIHGGIMDAKSPDTYEAIVDKVYIPATYFPNSITDDIAVLMLNRDLHLDEVPNLDKVNLPLPDESSHANDLAVLSGYGIGQVEPAKDATTEKVKVEKDYTLQYWNIRVLDNSQCSLIFNEMAPDSTLCGQAESQTDSELSNTCNANGGDPLVKDNTIIGVVSRVPKVCDGKIYPSLYTRVSSYVDFIENVMKGIKTSNMRLFDFDRSKEL